MHRLKWRSSASLVETVNQAVTRTGGLRCLNGTRCQYRHVVMCKVKMRNDLVAKFVRSARIRFDFMNTIFFKGWNEPECIHSCQDCVAFMLAWGWIDKVACYKSPHIMYIITCILNDTNTRSDFLTSKIRPESDIVSLHQSVHCVFHYRHIARVSAAGIWKRKRTVHLTCTKSFSKHTLTYSR